MRYTAARAPVADSITALLGERVAEVVPSESFDVRIQKKVIGLYGKGACAGNSLTLATAATWLMPLPTRRRLRLIFYGYPATVQEFISKAQGVPWPASGAVVKMDLTDDAVCVWWASGVDASVVLRMRPISRADLGV